DHALTEGKEEIQIEIKEKMQQLFDETYKCGLTVSDVFLQQVVPPKEVDAAFKDVISAKEDKERLINEAHGYQNEVIPTARGEAEKMIKGAQGYKVERIRRAQGDADRFNVIYTEYKKSPEITETRLYLETMEKILPRMQKYIVETDEGGGLLNILNLDKKDGSE
ncbi:MAG: FtsH protease activity modulator HflK, partial [Gemmatimonadetes bacterium]|nr:FtsH protease activity modulator HflK [Gemmatimonadota bacterium]